MSWQVLNPSSLTSTTRQMDLQGNCLTTWRSILPSASHLDLATSCSMLRPPTSHLSTSLCSPTQRSSLSRSIYQVRIRIPWYCQVNKYLFKAKWSSLRGLPLPLARPLHLTTTMWAMHCQASAACQGFSPSHLLKPRPLPRGLRRTWTRTFSSTWAKPPSTTFTSQIRPLWMRMESRSWLLSVLSDSGLDR